MTKEVELKRREIRERIAVQFKIARQEGALRRWADGTSDADGVLADLDNLDVVIKVKRGLPEYPKDDPEEDALDEGYTLGWIAMGRAATEAGYVATMPLIDKLV